MKLLKDIVCFVMFVLMVILILGSFLWSETNAASRYTQDAKYRTVPVSSETYKNAGIWNNSNASFAVLSTARGKKLTITLANLTTSGTYGVHTYFVDHTSTYQVEYDAATLAATAAQQSTLRNVSTTLGGVKTKTDKLPNYH